MEGIRRLGFRLTLPFPAAHWLWWPRPRLGLPRVSAHSLFDFLRHYADPSELDRLPPHPSRSCPPSLHDHYSLLGCYEGSDADEKLHLSPSFTDSCPPPGATSWLEEVLVAAIFNRRTPYTVIPFDRQTPHTRERKRLLSAVSNTVCQLAEKKHDSTLFSLCLANSRLCPAGSTPSPPFQAVEGWKECSTHALC
jgi:hypothetical protein